ncbi:MAG: DUF2786 domain-containing protein [Myxococcales bacterium]|nr:DUF2786 domain-containing protein [Myxococcales bacterium]
MNRSTGDTEPKPTSKKQGVAWLASLHRELVEIYYEQKFKGRRPSIRLSDSKQHWGSFDPLDFEITISPTLIAECPWWVVVEILKHEIAHIFVHAAFPNEERPHGKRFQAVCSSLNVAEWARGATVGKALDELRTLFDWRTAHLDARTEKYRSRLEKLLALANSTNENEALVAMQRARELQDNHHLEELDRGQPTRFVNLELNSGKQRHAPYEGRIASILINHYHVEAVFIARFNAETLRNEATIDLMGSREDVLLAEYVHGFLHRSAESLWQAHRKNNGAKGLRARNSFIRGLLVGFHKKLDDQNSSKEKNDGALSEHSALIQAGERGREEFKRKRYPRLVKRSSSARVDSGAFTHGKSEGGRLSIRTPITKTTRGPKLLGR